MEYTIRGENVEITSAIRSYVETKIDRITKYFHNDESYTANVKVKVYKTEQKVEVTIPMKQLTLRAEVSGDDLYAAIDLVVDKLERQIRKHKTKINRKWREKGLTTQEILFQTENVPTFDSQTESDDDSIKIDRHKRFELQVMDREEAILQMNMLGHDFYLFIDATTGNTSVVYTRKNNTYGYIETL